MSYIRCLSNPEGLYIWGEKSGRVAVTSYKQLGNDIKYVPCYIFETLLHKYMQSLGDERVVYRGAKLEELFIKSGKKQTKIDKQLGTYPGRYQWRLSYENWHVDMWESTLYYIAARSEKRWYRGKRRNY